MPAVITATARRLTYRDPHCYLSLDWQPHRGWAPWFETLIRTLDDEVLIGEPCQSPVTLLEIDGVWEVVLTWTLDEEEGEGYVVLDQQAQEALLEACTQIPWSRMTVPRINHGCRLDLACLGPSYSLNSTDGAWHSQPEVPADHVVVTGRANLDVLPRQMGILTLRGQYEHSEGYRPQVECVLSLGRLAQTQGTEWTTWGAPVLHLPQWPVESGEAEVLIYHSASPPMRTQASLETLNPRITQVVILGGPQPDHYYRQESVWRPYPNLDQLEEGVYMPSVFWIGHWSEIALLRPGWACTVVSTGFLPPPPGWAVHLTSAEEELSGCLPAQTRWTVYRRSRAKSARSAAPTLED